ncbi:cytosolic carboxypeptidase 2-like [Cyanistes caeruleus]|uniref:cytosolic carboxypeptidase 2-like n=1 Tax=Cyanistes caeruleus TaxID=156563 RepID=UPI000CDAA582|nr:cytosolic carboxypeptidase 2-like [Cyanistes caeruleus]
MGNTGRGWQRGPGHKPNPPGVVEQTPCQGRLAPSTQPWRFPGKPQALFSLPAPRWPVECEVIQETIEHIEWVPPKPEPFCPPMGLEQALYTLSEEQGTVVYHSSPAPQGSCFTRARVGGAPGPLSSPAAPLEGPQDTTLLFESRFESGNLQKAIKVGPYEYVLTLRPDLYTAKHTQWFYFRVQNTRQEPLYRFTIANMAKPKSLYGQGLQPLLYSQQDAQSHGIGWRRVGTDICYYRGSAGEPPMFRLSWTVRFPHDGDTCFFASCYPYTYSDLQRYLRALAADPARSRYCAVQALCRSLAGNTVYLLTITSPGGTAGKRVVVASARVHPGESSGSWAMRGFLDFLLSAHADARLLRRLFVFKVVPMLNPDGVVVGNSRCSLAGRDPNRAYGMALPGSFPGVWHLRAMVQRVLAEREVLLYCDFHGHSRKNNVFMYGCDAGGDGTGTRLRQRVFPLMLSKNAPDKVGHGSLRATCCVDSGNVATMLLPELSLWGWDPSDPGALQFSFSSCKFQVQKSREGTGRVSMWRLGVSHSYTLEVAFSGSTLGERRSSHFSVEDLGSLGRLLCDTLLDFCDPAPAKFQQCLVEADALLQQQMGRELGSGGSWSDVSPSELESSTSGSDSSVSDGIPGDFHSPDWPVSSHVPLILRWEGCRARVEQGDRGCRCPSATLPPSTDGAMQEEAVAETESKEFPAPNKPEPHQLPGEPGATTVRPGPEGTVLQGDLSPVLSHTPQVGLTPLLCLPGWDPQASSSSWCPEWRWQCGREAQSQLQCHLSQGSWSRECPPCHRRRGARSRLWSGPSQGT